MPPKPKVPLPSIWGQPDAEQQVGPQVPLPPGASDDDFIGKGVQTMLGTLGLGDDQSRWNRFGQLVGAGLPLAGGLVAGVKPEYIPFLREKAARMVEDVIQNGMPQHLGNGVMDPGARAPLTPEMARALRYAQQRYPRIMGHITNVAAMEPGMQTKAVGRLSPHTINSKFSYMELHPNVDYQNPTTIGHELLHAADSITQPDMLDKYTYFNSLPGGYNANSMEVRARGMGDTFATHQTNYQNQIPPQFQIVDSLNGDALPRTFVTQQEAQQALQTLSPKYIIKEIPGQGNHILVHDDSNRYLRRFTDPNSDEAQQFIKSFPEETQRQLMWESYPDQPDTKIPNSKRKGHQRWDKGQVAPWIKPAPGNSAISINTPNTPDLTKLVGPDNTTMAAKLSNPKTAPLTIKDAGDGRWHLMAGPEIIDTYPDKATAQAARDHATYVGYQLRRGADR